jgi:2-methylcitrate dehydratase
MTIVEQMAGFVNRASFNDLGAEALNQLKLHVLDTLGCAIGALGAPPARLARGQVQELGGRPQCTLIGGGKSSVDRAAFHNAVLVRYLDFMDNFLAKGETCHPSDNFAAVLAAAEYGGCSGAEMLTALAVAYQVQCRLTEAAPIMRSGFDHTTQQAFSVAAGVAKALRMDADATADALAISGVDSVSLAVNRAEPLSNWKGLASADEAFRSTHNTLFARRGISGPRTIFEGSKGFMEALGQKFRIDWETERLDVVPRTLLKKFNAEVHSQSVLEAVVELRERHHPDPDDIQAVHVNVFQTAYDIIGGGEFGEKGHPARKESADHDLPYLTAVALLDGEVYPEQFTPARIEGPDVRSLIAKVKVSPRRSYTSAYPEKMMCDVTIRTRTGAELACKKDDYEGFNTRPMPAQRVEAKFHRLAAPFADDALRCGIVRVVNGLEAVPVAELTGLLAQVRAPD